LSGSLPLRLAAIDLDGTLLNSEGQVSAGNAEALRRLAGAGVALAAATARWREAATRPFEQADVHAAVIACAGADVTLPDGAVVERRPLPAEFVPFVAELCEERGWRANLSLPGKTYRLEREMPPWAVHAPAWLAPVTSLGGTDLTGLLSVLVHVEPGDPGLAALDAWGERIAREWAISFDGSTLLTVTAAGVDKGTALRALCGRLGMGTGEVMAFGDSEVDLPMFAVAGLSVAMGQASAEVRSAASMTSAPADEDGFARAVERILAGE
jgi:Cof subfamily protein (haloacid dehalogenase superfamily)